MTQARATEAAPHPTSVAGLPCCKTPQRFCSHTVSNAAKKD